ncbi:MAG: hypothetical protein FWG99_12200 [Treponema sp.]|nr:hypothetical protein [Treponema sp.]
MAIYNKSVIVSGRLTFEEVIDETCEKLMDRQVQYSIRRIQEMGNLLDGLEHELDDILLQKDKLNG